MVTSRDSGGRGTWRGLARRAGRSLKRRLSRRPAAASPTPGGVAFYGIDPADGKEHNPGFQTYYRDNIESIRAGEVPERYTRIAALTPGASILEIGSADGVQCLTLARQGRTVRGVELMAMQLREALDLRSRWAGLGIDVGGCEFLEMGAMEATGMFGEVDTILMSRVLYHLRDDIEPLFREIAARGVENVVLVGCPKREARWRRDGAAGDAMGRYAFYAAEEGMKSVLKTHGFEIRHAISSQGGEDPVVVGARSVATGG